MGTVPPCAGRKNKKTYFIFFSSAQLNLIATTLFGFSYLCFVSSTVRILWWYARFHSATKLESDKIERSALTEECLITSCSTGSGVDCRHICAWWFARLTKGTIAVKTLTFHYYESIIVIDQFRWSVHAATPFMYPKIGEKHEASEMRFERIRLQKEVRAGKLIFEFLPTK